MPPKDAPLFSRSKLPLDSDRLSRLALSLSNLLAYAGQTPEDWQNRARIVALIASINPEFPDTGRLNNDLRKGVLPTLKNPEDFESARKNVWATYQWLSSPDAGPDANLAASCILDIMARVDPAHPQITSFDATQLDSHWANSIPPLEKFGKPTSNPDSNSTASTPTPSPTTPEQPSNPDTPAAAPPPTFSPLAQSISYPGFFLQGDNGAAQAIIPLQVKISGITNTPHNPETNVHFLPSHPPEIVAAQLPGIRSTLLANWKNSWPTGGSFQINTSRPLANVRSNAELISFPVALSLIASSSGASIPENTSCIAFLQNDGSLQIPRYWWKATKPLRQSDLRKRSTLIAATGMGDQMKNILLDGNPDFFLSSCVAEFPSTQAAAQWLLKPTPEQAEARKLFDSVRDIYFSRKKTGNSISVDKTCRDTLTQVVKLDPANVSAKMILLHGGEAKFRPRFYDLAIYARELENAFFPLNSLVENDLANTPADRISDAYETLRDNLSTLKNFAPREADSITKKTSSLALTLRNLASAAKQAASSSPERQNFRKEQVRKYSEEAKQLHSEVKEWIANELAK